MSEHVTFVAKYRSPCAACGEQIEVGDTCTWTDHLAVHEDCAGTGTPYAAQAARAIRPVCGECFIETAANGSCGCEE